jgi:hypothetical protein
LSGVSIKSNDEISVIAITDINAPETEALQEISRVSTGSSRDWLRKDSGVAVRDKKCSLPKLNLTGPKGDGLGESSREEDASQNKGDPNEERQSSASHAHP